MQTRYLLLAALPLLSLAAGCHDAVDDFGGTAYLRGRLLYTDQLAGPSGQQPLPGRLVYLAASPSDQTNFKYSVTTDKDGYFTFEHLDGGKTYDLFFGDTVRRVRYSALKTLRPQDAPFALLATNDERLQNGLAVTVQAGQGGTTAVANTPVCVFTSRLLARADTCLNPAFTLTTDAAGRAVRYNLTPGTYYFYAITRLAGQTYRTQTSPRDSAVVKPAGIIRSTLQLTPYSRRRNGFDLLVLDGQNTPLANLDVCVFNSAVLAQVDTCLGSVAQYRTDLTGRVYASNLPPRRYYLRLRGNYGRLRLRGYDTLSVNSSGIVTRTVKAQ